MNLILKLTMKGENRYVPMTSVLQVVGKEVHLIDGSVLEVERLDPSSPSHLMRAVNQPSKKGE